MSKSMATSAAPTGPSKAPGNPNLQQQQSQAEQEEEQKAQQEQMMNQILAQVLDQPARARLSTIKLAKPDKGAQIEGLLINMARMGQLRGKIGEDELIGLLEKVSESTKAKTKTTVKFNRRKLDSSDDEDYNDL